MAGSGTARKTAAARQPSRLAALTARVRSGLASRLSSGAGRMALVVLAIRISGAGLAYVSQVLLARWMGANDYGIFAVVWTLAMVLGLLASLGFSASPARFIPQYTKARDFDRLRGFLCMSRIIALGAASLVTLIGLEIILQARPLIDPAYVWPTAIALLAVPMFAITAVQDAIARSHDLPALGLIASFITRPLLLLAFLLPLVLTGHTVTAAIAAVMAVAASLVAAAHQAFRLARALRPRIPAGPERLDLRLWIAVSLPLLLMEGFIQLLGSADVIMVSLFRSPDEVAIYFAASKTLALVYFIHFAVRSASAHRFAALARSADRSDLSAYARQASRWTFWPSLAGGIALVLASPLLLGLFGPEFTDGTPLLAILLIGALARASIGPADALLGMTGSQKSCAIVYAGIFGLNIALNAVLIPAYGLSGAAIATAIAMVIETIALSLVAAGRLGFVPFALLPNRRARNSHARSA